jgi:hypothetical protein
MKSLAIHNNPRAQMKIMSNEDNDPINEDVLEAEDEEEED